MGRQLFTHRVERVEMFLRRIGSEGSFRYPELPLERDRFAMKRDHLTKACAGVILRCPAPKEPFIQASRLGFKPVQKRTQTLCNQVVPEARPFKARAQSRAIYDFRPERVKLARFDFGCGKFVL